MKINNPSSEADFPFSDLLGIKKKNETPEKKFRREMRELARKFPVDNSVDNTQAPDDGGINVNDIPF